MRILKFKKVKVGDSYPVVRVTYKNFWGNTISRDAAKDKYDRWVFLDNEEWIYDRTALDIFFDSREYSFVINYK